MPTTACRCFPKFPPEYSHSLVGAALGGNATGNTGAYADWFDNPGNRLTQYIGDISKGILIIIVAGLAAGIVLSMVRPCHQPMFCKVGRQRAVLYVYTWIV